MQTIQQTYRGAYSKPHTNILNQFIDWCKGQEKNHFGWVGIMLVVHGCILAPVSLYSIFAAGNNMLLWIMVISAMAVSLIGNLAALSTRITIPVFFFTVLVDLAVIGYCTAGLLK